MRKFTPYFLICLNVVVLSLLIGLLVYVGNLRDDVRTTALSQNLGCRRANVQRDAMRFLLLARVHDAKLIHDTGTNKEIADYFGRQAVEAQAKLDALLASAALTFPLDNDKFLVDCDRTYPLP